MKIAFWSPLHGTGASSGLLAVAVALSILDSKKIVVSQTHYNLNNLERPLLGSIGNGDFFRDTGVDALLRFFKSGNITEEHIENCSIKMSETLYLLAGTKTTNREGFESSMHKGMLLHIFSCLEKYFDMVLVDTNSGNNELSMRVVEECDAVVVSLRQNRDMLDSFFESGLFEDKHIFYMFPDFDPESRYSMHNLRTLYKKMNSGNSSFLPHNTGYMDAICDEKVLKFISSNIDADKTVQDYAFFCSLRKTALMITEFLKIRLLDKTQGEV
ncbi:MAG: hypothetical protein J5718_02545 [Lachnospiraceae bacterium]|nr:hypothetical protein [Lachnospiraceae bacterium]